MFCYKGMNCYFPCSLMKNGRKNPLGIVCGQYGSSAVAGWKTGGGLGGHRIKCQSCEPLGGCLGTCPSSKFWNLEVWNYYFQHSPRAICNLCLSWISSYSGLAMQFRLKKYNTCNVNYKTTKLVIFQASILPVRDSESSIISLLLNCLRCLRGKCRLHQHVIFWKLNLLFGCYFRASPYNS